MDTDPDDLAQLGDSILGWLGVSRCPSCNKITDAALSGGVTLCLRCTEAELGVTAEENAVRIGAGMSLAQWLARPVDDEYPLAKRSRHRTRMFGRGWSGG